MCIITALKYLISFSWSDLFTRSRSSRSRVSRRHVVSKVFWRSVDDYRRTSPWTFATREDIWLFVGPALGESFECRADLRELFAGAVKRQICNRIRDEHARLDLYPIITESNWVLTWTFKNFTYPINSSSCCSISVLTKFEWLKIFLVFKLSYFKEQKNCILIIDFSLLFAMNQIFIILYKLYQSMHNLCDWLWYLKTKNLLRLYKILSTTHFSNIVKICQVRLFY